MTVSLKTYIISIPRRGRVKVKAYSPNWAARQGCNALRVPTQKWAWVGEIARGGRLMKMSREKVYRGLGDGDRLWGVR